MDPTSWPTSPVRVVSTFTSPLETILRSTDDGATPGKLVDFAVGLYHSPVTNAIWEAVPKFYARFLNPVKDGPPQTELVTKTPSQSRASLVYEFSSDYTLRGQYRNPWNEVWVGKLLEDLDVLAGFIAFKVSVVAFNKEMHIFDDDPMRTPPLIVTASVDKIALKKPIQVDTDLKIAGAVTWAGRSSVLIRIEVTQIQQGNTKPLDTIVLTADFTYVARDLKTGKSAPINRLRPETEREKLLQEEGEAKDKAKKRRREEQKRELEGNHTGDGKTERLRTLLAESGVFCDMPALADRDSILMRDTALESSLICQPQQTNLYGLIFGGFLMHQSFDLAFSTAYAFVGQMPCFLEVDHVDFLKPVDVGDFLRFKSRVLYTQLENPEQPLINIEVVIHVARPELRTSEVANALYFTFTIKPDAVKNGLKMRSVVPGTEEEARRVLERMDAAKIVE